MDYRFGKWLSADVLRRSPTRCRPLRGCPARIARPQYSRDRRIIPLAGRSRCKMDTARPAVIPWSARRSRLSSPQSRPFGRVATGYSQTGVVVDASSARRFFRPKRDGGGLPLPALTGREPLCDDENAAGGVGIPEDGGFNQSRTAILIQVGFGRRFDWNGGDSLPRVPTDTGAGERLRETPFEHTASNGCSGGELSAGRGCWRNWVDTTSVSVRKE